MTTTWGAQLWRAGRMAVGAELERRSALPDNSQRISLAEQRFLAARERAVQAVERYDPMQYSRSMDVVACAAEELWAASLALREADNLLLVAAD